MTTVGIIGDTHEPFTHPKYMRFVQDTFDIYGVDRVVHIGDLVDNHAISYHEVDPDGYSAGDEYRLALKRVKKWVKSFPNVDWIEGNHDALPQRKLKSAGLSRSMLKAPKEIWEVPDTWHLSTDIVIDGVLYCHGIGSAGINGHRNLALKSRQSAVMGHCHSFGGVAYMASKNDIIFGMNVGCGIDVRAYAMEYGKHFTVRPTLGCGIVIDGKTAHWIPMDFTQRKYRR